MLISLVVLPLKRFLGNCAPLRLLRFNSGLLLAFILLAGIASAAQQQSPADLQTALQSIQSRLAQGDLTGARRQIEFALKQFPAQAALYDYLGVVDAQAGKSENARSDFEQAIKLDPHLTGSYLNLGHLLVDAASHDSTASAAALNVYQRLLRVDPGNAEAHFQSAWLLYRSGFFHRSIQHLDRLTPREQAQARAQALRCADLAGQGRSSAAADIVDRLVVNPQLRENDVTDLLPELERQHRNWLAIRLLAGLAAAGRASNDTLLQLSRLYEEAGNFSAAQETLARLAAEDPHNTTYLIQLADFAARQHDYTQALGYLAHARDIDPANARIPYLMGVACAQTALVMQAYDYLQTAVHLAPQEPEYIFALASVALDQPNRAATAVELFQRYLQLRPGDLQGQFALAGAYFNLGKDDEATRLFRALAAHQIYSARAHYYLGRLAERQSHLSEARAEYETSAREDARYAPALAELGVLDVRARNYGHALDELRRAVALDPKNFTANYNLALVYQRTADPAAAAQLAIVKQLRQEQSERERRFSLTVRAVPINESQQP